MSCRCVRHGSRFVRLVAGFAVLVPLLLPAVAAGVDGKAVRLCLEGSPEVPCSSVIGTVFKDTTGVTETSWYWPSALFLTLQCGSQEILSSNGFNGRAASARMFRKGDRVGALLCGLLGMESWIATNRYDRAYADYLSIQAQSYDRKDASIALLNDLVRASGYYCAAKSAEYRIVRTKARPYLVITPLDVRGDAELTRDEDAASAAMTWLIIESLQRVLKDYPLPGNRACITIDDDLGLRFSNGRVSGVNSKFDQPFTLPGWNYRLPEYMRSLYQSDSGNAFIAGYVSRNPVTVSVSVRDLDSKSNWPSADEISRSVIDVSTGDGRKVEQAYQDVAGLALDVALTIVERLSANLAPGASHDRLRPRGEWRVLPGNTQIAQRAFELFIEAVGFETRNDLYMASQRYAELLELCKGSGKAELALIEERYGRCRALLGYDTPARFLKKHDAELREVILKRF